MSEDQPQASLLLVMDTHLAKRQRTPAPEDALLGALANVMFAHGDAEAPSVESARALLGHRGPTEEEGEEEGGEEAEEA